MPSSLRAMLRSIVLVGLIAALGSGCFWWGPRRPLGRAGRGGGWHEERGHRR